MARQAELEDARPDESRRRGRPLGPGLRDRLLDHTFVVLLEVGYARFSMNRVARSARASKETLYRHFGDRKGLLAAALERNARYIEPLLAAGLDEARDPTERLARLARNYLDGAFRPEAIALQRLAIAEGDGRLGGLYARHVTEVVLAFFEAELARLGSLDPPADADAFFGLARGSLHPRVLVGELEPGTPEPGTRATGTMELEAAIEAQAERASRRMVAHLRR